MFKVGGPKGRAEQENVESRQKRVEELQGRLEKMKANQEMREHFFKNGIEVINMVVKASPVGGLGVFPEPKALREIKQRLERKKEETLAHITKYCKDMTESQRKDLETGMALKMKETPVILGEYVEHPDPEHAAKEEGSSMRGLTIYSISRTFLRSDQSQDIISNDHHIKVGYTGGDLAALANNNSLMPNAFFVEIKDRNTETSVFLCAFLGSLQEGLEVFVNYGARSSFCRSDDVFAEYFPSETEKAALKNFLDEQKTKPAKELKDIIMSSMQKENKPSAMFSPNLCHEITLKIKAKRWDDIACIMLFNEIMWEWLQDKFDKSSNIRIALQELRCDIRRDKIKLIEDAKQKRRALITLKEIASDPVQTARYITNADMGMIANMYQDKSLLLVPEGFKWGDQLDREILHTLPLMVDTIRNHIPLKENDKLEKVAVCGFRFYDYIMNMKRDMVAAKKGRDNALWYTKPFWDIPEIFCEQYAQKYSSYQPKDLDEKDTHEGLTILLGKIKAECQAQKENAEGCSHIGLGRFYAMLKEELNGLFCNGWPQLEDLGTISAGKIFSVVWSPKIQGFVENAKVKVYGLNTPFGKKFNGQIGEIKSFDKTSRPLRAAVMFATSRKRTVKIKLENLKPCTTKPEESHPKLKT
ncbi:MAG: hypothetical protein VYC40_02160 [Pseudomonadota bacterium]|nr:hypothetical protein [Pseudomonadota bacterium]